MTYWQRLLINTLTLVALAYMFPNMMYVDSVFVALMASFVLSILNTLVKPVLHFFSLPITILTFGLFSLVINGMMLTMTSALIGKQHFAFSSFGAAFLIALIMSLVNAIFVNKKVEKYF
ncbi:phage holin family protein [Vagococcus lutrae]|uniref:phage holin family protein n=1 Tax=Vagococcus lutrae TaxID=81947 RepID=UPI001C955F8D|nr:phage holin family protein [Vagococcus lutrae]MDT2816501.1 phage holin family protein [Vagococcus lutrae]MDY3706060.1 phage holin family protein [Vagococcus lutrae]QZN89316.1 phage holin family protein [Vagococcus lutrae]UQF11817.1 phage holin family protein [Vagococcus lutrae]UQF39101.1 phage holin family protein [Vagococcus lutrae]